ncbi:MAG: histidine kinase [Lachnospiraceae bacterium]|nr:histidine kinase [Lachnospiraceae bacterium]
MGFLKKLKQEYDNFKIQTKFAICILIAILTPFMVLGMMFAGRIYDMVASDTIRNEQEASLRIVPTVEAVMKQVYDSYGILAELLGNDGVSEVPEAVAQMLDRGMVEAVKIYVDMPVDSLLFSHEVSQGIFAPLSLAKGTYWYGILQGSREKYLYCPPFYLGNREMNLYGDCAYIVSRELVYQEQVYPCYVAVYYDSATLEEIMQKGASFPGGVSYIINERDAVIASTDDYLTGMYYINYEDISSYLMSSNNFIERNILGEKLYVSFNAIAQTGWFMVTVTPSGPLLQHTARVLLGFVLICICCIVIAFLLAMWQARSITTRISLLVQQMAEGRKGTPVSMPSPTVRDEVGELIETYNYMTGRINELLEKQKETAEELRIAEFNSLQAQINPHFLYNTMDMIHWMALKGQTEEISSAVQRLARFYKLTLSHKSNFMSIEEELEHVSTYVDLQNMRFKNAIDFVIDIPDELLNSNIPKLTLQPIVENAILHGILEKDMKSGVIVITGWREDDDMILLVSDDGVGIPKEKLPGILSGQRTGSTGGTNIAVYNIHKRLKLLYGESYGLQYTSTLGQGTDVRIKIPVSM